MSNPSLGSATHTCPDCRGMGLVSEDWKLDGGMDNPARFCACPAGEAAYARARAASAQQAVAYRHRERQVRADLAMPYRYAEYQLSTSPTRDDELGAPSWAQVTRWFEELRDGDHPGEWLLLWGGFGAGKTGMAAGGVNELLIPEAVDGAYERLAWVSTTRLMHRLKDAMRTHEDTALFNHYADADVLVLDDLGAERGTSYDIDKLWALLDHRFSESLTTIITTNLNMFELRDYLGERSFYRLLNAALTVEVQCKEMLHLKAAESRIARLTGGEPSSQRLQVVR